MRISVQSVHEERLEFLRDIEGAFKHHCLRFQLLAQGGAVGDVLGHELTFHAALVLEEEAGATFGVELDAAVLRLEVGGVEDLVSEEVESEGLGKGAAFLFTVPIKKA